MNQSSPKELVQSLLKQEFTQWEIAERLGITTAEMSFILKYDCTIADPPEEGINNGREAYLWHKYKMTVSEYDQLLESQNGCCFVCKRTPEQLGKRLFVDHNHSTGKVRGLLCPRCNSLLSAFNENVALACNAVEYLMTPPASNTPLRNADPPPPTGKLASDWDKLGQPDVYKGAAVCYPPDYKPAKKQPQP